MDVLPYEETLVESNFSGETSVASDESFRLDENSSSESHPDISTNTAEECLVSAAERLCINECNVKNLGEESTVYVNEGIGVESIEEDAVSGAETESFKSATEELDYSADSFVIAGDAEGNSCTSSMRRDNGGCSQYDHNTNLADIGKPSFIFAALSASLPGLQHQCLFKRETWNQSWPCLTCLHSNCQNFA
ncbi:hypothetical protein F511_44893 [Dorcoceras hygrometricum]|uniref:Uncharacterized protein n=1 Tax=Dorcoceras hygrometricum TaxID=472368 RepID=A0A2Z6ZX99_9LAMI|nr:hypothetical protein F511_44893 [Dorcoceras hygrometricum]